MLVKIGVEEQYLVCAETYPLSMQARDALLLAGGPKRRLYHNCSGKHLGVLAWCRAMGVPLDGYADPEHPAQREILRAVSAFSGVPEADIPFGTDGCGFPVFALRVKEPLAEKWLTIRLRGVCNRFKIYCLWIIRLYFYSLFSVGVLFLDCCSSSALSSATCPSVSMEASISSIVFVSFTTASQCVAIIPWKALKNS